MEEDCSIILYMLTVHPLMFRFGAVCGGLGDTVISCCF